MKKILALVLAAAMALSLIACGQKQEQDGGNTNENVVETPKTLQIGVTTQEDMADPFYMVAAMIKQYVEEHGDGSLTVEVLANSQLGGEREMFEGQQLGRLT